MTVYYDYTKTSQGYWTLPLKLAYVRIVNNWKKWPEEPTEKGYKNQSTTVIFTVSILK